MKTFRGQLGKITLGFGLLFIMSSAKAGIIYVNELAGGTYDGQSWSTGYLSVQDALGAAVSGDTIVVAKGTYTPHANDRTVSFVLKEGVLLMGGFDGTETSFDQSTLDARDFETNKTILSGDLGGDDNGFVNNSENSYHVVSANCSSSSITAITVLDGFTIAGGNANYYTGVIYDDIRGGGISLVADLGYTCSPTIRNIIVEGNTAQIGAGISIVSQNTGSVANPSFSNFIIRNNQTKETDDTQVSSGAGISIAALNSTSNPVFLNGEITRNTVVEYTSAGVGGGLTIGTSDIGSTTTASPVFTDVLFCGNLASGGGSQISTGTTGNNCIIEAEFTNVTLAGGVNSVPVYNIKSGGLAATSAPVFTNSLINTSYGQSVLNSPAPSSSGPNPVYSYSNVRGAYMFGPWSTGFGVDGGNNMDEDSDFFDTTNCDVRLYNSSPEINTGNSTDGNNIGQFQGTALIYLNIVDLEDITECSATTNHVLKFAVEDEPADGADYSIELGTGDLMPEYLSDAILNDTLQLTIDLPDNWFGRDTITIKYSNNQGETDSTDLIFTLSQRPHLSGFETGAFDASDSTFIVILNDDTTMLYEDYFIDDIDIQYNWSYGIGAGTHYGLIEKDGCFSDTLWFDIPEYINEIPLTINYFEDTSRITLCKGDTTLKFEFNFLDDNIENIEWMFNYHYIKIIPDSNITQFETDTSYGFIIDVPDTLGRYELHVHAENIFFEMANLYYVINIATPPTVDTVYQYFYAQDTCIQPSISGYDYNYRLTLLLDGSDVTNMQEICGMQSGVHTMIAFHDNCPSAPYTFTIEQANDPGGSDPGGNTNINLLNKEGILVYPNPAQHIVTIEGIDGVFDLRITDLSGNTIYEAFNQLGKSLINIETFDSGIYYLQISNENGDYLLRKILKE